MKRTVAFILVLVLSLGALVSCGVSNPIIGEWRDETTHKNGFLFKEDGSVYFIMEDRVMYELGSQAWEVKDGKLCFDGTEYADYLLMDGKLTVWLLKGGIRIDDGTVYLKK